MTTRELIEAASAHGGEATYCPEDNKLRLYVGRVDRPVFDALRAQGWAVCSKQREDGKGDFAAVWTPEREDTARAFSGGYIGDEDAGPAERAADRAERFSGYQGKRMDEATGHADAYDGQPAAHGYQNPAKAERAAARHDRIADRALDAWGRAEYWQSRTAGVIGHALYVSQPGVRMGRIKKLESELRKSEASAAEYVRRFAAWTKTAATDDPTEAYKRAYALANNLHAWSEYRHPRPATCQPWHKDHDASLYSLLTDAADPITGKEAAALWLSDHAEPKEGGGRWLNHYKLRLAYERQMLEAQGGTLESACADIVPGGFIGRRQIVKVNKSPATGRVVSVAVIAPDSATHDRWGNQYPTGVVGKPRLAQIDVERLSPGAYRPPTDEERAAFEAGKKAEKAERKATTPKEPPLVNPTDADAERLQAAWNASGKWREPCVIERMTQAEYSARSGGNSGRYEPEEITGGGLPHARAGHMNRPTFPTVAKIRAHYGRVIVLTDKPQKALPAAVWEDPRPATLARVIARMPELSTLAARAWFRESDWTDSERALWDDAWRLRLVYVDSMTQFGLTEAGHAAAKGKRGTEDHAAPETCVVAGVTYNRIWCPSGIDGVEQLQWVKAEAVTA